MKTDLREARNTGLEFATGNNPSVGRLILDMVNELSFYRRPPKEVRFYGDGPVSLMARSDHYVMVRRPGCIPFIMAEAEWDALPKVSACRRSRTRWGAWRAP